MQETLEARVQPCVRKIPWTPAWQPTPVFLPGETHGQGSLAGYSPWGHKEWTWPKWLSTHTRSLAGFDEINHAVPDIQEGKMGSLSGSCEQRGKGRASSCPSSELSTSGPAVGCCTIWVFQPTEVWLRVEVISVILCASGFGWDDSCLQSCGFLELQRLGVVSQKHFWMTRAGHRSRTPPPVLQSSESSTGPSPETGGSGWCRSFHPS